MSYSHHDMPKAVIDAPRFLVPNAGQGELRQIATRITAVCGPHLKMKSVIGRKI
jgi:hypothetical protein